MNRLRVEWGKFAGGKGQGGWHFEGETTAMRAGRKQVHASQNISLQPRVQHFIHHFFSGREGIVYVDADKGGIDYIPWRLHQTARRLLRKHCRRRRRSVYTCRWRHASYLPAKVGARSSAVLFAAFHVLLSAVCVMSQNDSRKDTGKAFSASHRRFGTSYFAWKLFDALVSCIFFKAIKYWFYFKRRNLDISR